MPEGDTIYRSARTLRAALGAETPPARDALFRLEVLVRRLRRKIDDGFEPKLIHTLRGVGYRLGE